MKATKQFLKDLKEASRCVLYRDRKGQGMLKLIFEDEVRGVKVETEKKYLVDAELRDYEANRLGSYDSKVSCVVSEMDLYSNNSPWKSVFKTLKEGDDLTFEFIASNNQYLKDASLFNDRVYLLVKRLKRDTSLERSRFLLDQSVCPNNSARMIGGSELSSLGFQSFDPTSLEFVNHVDKNG